MVQIWRTHKKRLKGAVRQKVKAEVQQKVKATVAKPKNRTTSIKIAVTVKPKVSLQPKKEKKKASPSIVMDPMRRNAAPKVRLKIGMSKKVSLNN